MTDRKRKEEFVPRIVYRRKPPVPVPAPEEEPEAARRPPPPLPGDPPATAASRTRPDWESAPRETPAEPSRTGRRTEETPAPEFFSSVFAKPLRPRPAVEGRGRVVWTLAAVDAGLAAALGLVVLWLFRVRAWEIEESFDVAEQLQMAVTGLNIMIFLAAVAAAGFLLSAAGLLSLRPGGRRFAVVWAVLVTLTGIGGLYGIPALVLLFGRDLRARFV